MGAVGLGVALDSSVLIAAERDGLSAREAIQRIQALIGETDGVLCSITVAELAHGFHRADSDQQRKVRRRFLDDLKNTIPGRPVTAETAEALGRIGAELSTSGLTVPLTELLIGVCAMELSYAMLTRNHLDFEQIPNLAIVEA